jgi:YVTN family beta-propeller protein
MRNITSIFSLIVLLTLTVCLNSRAAPFAYITNSGSNTVSVIDTATNKVTATIPVGSGPAGVAGYHAGNRVYVANRGSGTVSVINTANNTVIATIPVGPFANAVAVKPDGTRLFVTYGNVNRGFGLAYGYLAAINLATNKVIATQSTTFKYGPVNAMAVNPAGTRLYLSNGAINVTVWDTATTAYLAGIHIFPYDYGIAVNPTGTRVYVANPGYAGSYSSVNSNLLVIDTATNTVIATIPPGILTTAYYPSGPVGVAVNPAGTRVYVTGRVTIGGTGYVLAIDPSTKAVVATIAVGANPQGVAVKPDGTKVYVANTGSNTVSVIDTSTNKVIATIPVGTAPIALGKFIQ